MNKLYELFVDQARKNGGDAAKVNLVIAPGKGGDYSGDGVAMRNGPYVAEIGEYANNVRSKNQYGYAGYQPYEIGRFRFGGAVGAYGRLAEGDINALAGLLASTPIMNGEARMLLSPPINGKEPGFFLSYDKKF